MQRDLAFLDEALPAIREIQTLLESTSEAQFSQQPFEQSYLFHRLVILGEATVPRNA